MSMSSPVCLLSQAAVTIFTWSASLDQTVASHSQVNSEYMRHYYSWIRRLTEKECVRAPNGAPPQFLPDPPSCDLCLCPRPALHRPNGIFLPSNYWTREISNYLQFHQIVAAERGSGHHCHWLWLHEHWTLTNQRSAWRVSDQSEASLRDPR